MQEIKRAAGLKGGLPPHLSNYSCQNKGLLFVIPEPLGKGVSGPPLSLNKKG